jgi:undecaprenyl-diphosphatase
VLSATGLADRGGAKRAICAPLHEVFGKGEIMLRAAASATTRYRTDTRLEGYMSMKRSKILVLSGLMLCTVAGVAQAADPPVAAGAAAPAPAPAASAAAAAPSSTATPDKAPIPASGDLQAPSSTKRAETLEPKPVYLPPTLNGARLQADPIADGAMLGIAIGFAGLSTMVLSTGEIRPQQISSTFDTSKLLGIDRVAVTQTVDPNAKMLSNIGLYAAIGYTLIDTIATGFREGSKQSALVDGIIYAEALAITTGVTNLAKVAVRRPRPYAYVQAAAHKNDPNYSNADSDSSLSFFSGHSATVGAAAGVATYLAFTRSPNSIRPWLTLAGGTALTAFVSVERVRAGDHFPTDVIAGAMAGAGIGVLVAHLHREDSAKQRRVWIGFTPGAGQGGMATLGGLF